MECGSLHKCSRLSKVYATNDARERAYVLPVCPTAHSFHPPFCTPCPCNATHFCINSVSGNLRHRTTPKRKPRVSLYLFLLSGCMCNVLSIYIGAKTLSDLLKTFLLSSTTTSTLTNSQEFPHE